MHALVLLALAVGAGAADARAAPPTGRAPIEKRTSIENLVREYRSGLHERAVAAATLWSAERATLEIGRLIVEEASREDGGEREARRLAAAAILTGSSLSRLRDGDLRLLAPG